MSSNYTWFSILNLVLHGSISIVVLAVVVIGWMRHRRLGFLVLALWALVNLFNSFQSIIVNALQPWLTQMFPQADRAMLVYVPYMVSYLVSSVLLLTGLALLVFRDKPMPKSTGV